MASPGAAWQACARPGGRTCEALGAASHPHCPGWLLQARPRPPAQPPQALAPQLRPPWPPSQPFGLRPCPWRPSQASLPWLAPQPQLRQPCQEPSRPWPCSEPPWVQPCAAAWPLLLLLLLPPCRAWTVAAAGQLELLPGQMLEQRTWCWQARALEQARRPKRLPGCPGTPRAGTPSPAPQTRLKAPLRPALPGACPCGLTCAGPQAPLPLLCPAGRSGCLVQPRAAVPGRRACSEAADAHSRRPQQMHGSKQTLAPVSRGPHISRSTHVPGIASCKVPLTAGTAQKELGTCLLLFGHAASSMCRGRWLPALPGRPSCDDRRSFRPGFVLLCLVSLLRNCLPSVQLGLICARHQCRGMLPAALYLMLAPHASKGQGFSKL